MREGWRRFLDRVRGEAHVERMESDLDDELRFHLEMETEKNIREGMSAAAARAAALRTFGGVDRVKEEVRHIHRFVWLEGLFRDLRFALRSARKSPGYTTVVILILGLGIGANTAIFSVMHGVLLKPLENRDGHRLMVLRQHLTAAGEDEIGFSVPDLQEWRARLRTVDAVVESHQMSFNLIGEGEPEEVLAGVVDHRFFDVMGMDPLLGRGFTEEEDRIGGEAVMVLSHPYWQRRFGGDPGVLGRTFLMNDRIHTVVGVLPDLPQYPRANDIYVPTSQCPIRSSEAFRENRNGRMMQAFLRIGSGGGIEQLRGEIDGVAGRLRSELPGDYPGERGYAASVAPLQEVLVANSRSLLLVLLGTAGLVLLVACANVANLSLARLSRREQEFAVRRALGGGEGRIARQLLAESTVLAVGGGVVGLVLARTGLDLLVSYASRFTPRAAEAELSAPVLVFALVAAVATGILAGTFPLVSSRRRREAGVLREASGATRTVRKLRAQNGLVVAQVGLAFVLLTGATLLLRSLLILQAVDDGFEARNVVTARVAFPVGGAHSTAETQDLFWTAVLARLEAHPEVEAVAAANLAPLAGGGGTTSVRIEGGVGPAGAAPVRVQPRVVSPGYFAVAGIPILAGEGFPAALRRGDEPVAVVNRTFARAHFGEASALGARLVPCNAQGQCSATASYRVVGVVGDVRQGGLEVEPAGEVYTAGPQQPFWGSRILLRTRGEPSTVVRDMVAAVHAQDPTLPVEDIRTLDQLRSESLAPRRLTAFLVGGFAALALAVTLAGIAGVTAFTVAQRRREIGIRMALGADRPSVLGLVLRDALVLVGVGLGVGVAGALVLGGTLRSFLWGIAPTDPVTHAVVGLVLLAAAAVACWVPARRATRVDPMVAFRG
jgi:putative ABC transport system permease protein